MLLISFTLLYASVLMLVALGGCFSEHSGVINIGLEGIMVIGAMGGALVLSSLSPELPFLTILLLTVLASVISGMVYSLLLAVAAVNFSADQTLVGLKQLVYCFINGAYLNLLGSDAMLIQRIIYICNY